MKQQLKCLAGSVLHHLAPNLSREVDEGCIDGPQGKLKRLIVDYRTSRAAASGDANSLRKQLAHYWKSARGDEFYDAYPERFEKWFLGDHYPVVEALADQLKKRPEIHRLIEVGCGDGKVLQHLSDRFRQFNTAIGIDLNSNIIERNREVYDDTSLQFESADLHEFLQSYLGSGILLVSYGGVLEYLTQTELEDLFASFKNLASPVMLMLVEPIALNFDLAQETQSRPHGIENSFSHPHRHLLEAAGWTIQFEEVQELEHRWMLMIASA
ncbi:MAG: class I SAM-dependent methyltransferase [Verrucomicrobiales bacterium]|nr:class I SAM-dependent methyltransferase [Verrucomicrobiales bacterium]